MSVVHAEMESFLGKFSLLATYGVDANLTFSSSGGKVSVDLKADLGYLKACNLQRNRPYKSSRIRRRQRREAARALNKEVDRTETLSTPEVDLNPSANEMLHQPDNQTQDVTNFTHCNSTASLPVKPNMIDRASLAKPELSVESLLSVDIPPGKRPSLTIVSQPPTSIPPRKIYHPAVIKACYAITGKHHPSQLLPDETKRLKNYIDQKREMGEPVETDLLYLPTSMRNCVHCGHPT